MAHLKQTDADDWYTLGQEFQEMNNIEQAMFCYDRGGCDLYCLLYCLMHLYKICIFVSNNNDDDNSNNNIVDMRITGKRPGVVSANFSNDASFQCCSVARHFTSHELHKLVM